MLRRRFLSILGKFLLLIIYWIEKGWLNLKRIYYVYMPVNPVYNAVGWASEQVLKRKIRKYVTEVQK